MKTTLMGYKFSLWCSLLLLAISCNTSGTDEMNITGQWEGVSWNVQSRESDLADEVWFEFLADSTYSAGFGIQHESGVYHIDAGKLYTTAEDKIEKMVGITQRGNDTLVLEMNRMGTLEVLVLTRKR